MSGPKLSAAEIEARQKAQLERERQEKLRQLMKAQDQYKAAKVYVSGLKIQLNEFFNAHVADINAISTDGATMMKKSIQQLLIQMEMNPVKNSASIEDWINSAKQSRDFAMELLVKGKAIIEQETNRVGVISGKATSAEQHVSLSKEIENIVKEDSQVQKSIEFFTIPQDSIERKLSLCLEELHALTEREHTPMLKRASVLAREIDDTLSVLKSEQNTIVNIRAQALINREQDLVNEIEECETLYNKYCALAAIVHVDPLDLIDFDGIKTLEDMIHSLNCQYQKKDEMNYIADQINQVMLDLGYQFVSSHILEQDVVKDVSVYGANEDAGIVVYTGDNGEIMMQVVSFGSTEEMSEEELYDSLDLQLRFCASHQDIVDELKKRGVLLRQINYAPPRKKYAKKICLSNSASQSQETSSRRRHEYEPRKAMRKM